MQKKVTLIGLGYVGLPLAALLASRGFQVAGVDTDPHVVRKVNTANAQSTERGLDELLHEAIAQGALHASEAMVAGDVYLIAVPTPLSAGHTPDLAHVYSAARRLAAVLKAGDLVILESTSPVGTTELLSRWLAEERPDLHFPHSHGSDAQVQVAYCPERVLPGNALHELEHNDRVIGGLTPRCAELAAAFYRCFVSGECPTTDSRTAEMCKLAENSFRDVNIAFANELSMLCERTGVDTHALISLANRHPRVAILQPGPGVGGHCVAVDPWFLVHAAPDLATLTRTARQVNDSKPAWVIAQVEKAVAELQGLGLAAPTIACLGLSFKADIDDLRESPALAISLELAKRFPDRVCAVEPNLPKLPAGLDQKLRWQVLAQALRCDVLVLLVNHRQFAAQPLRLSALQRLVDTRSAHGVRHAESGSPT